VPFFLMPSLGGGRSLRGYHTYRFRDRHSIEFTGEYRWYVQEFVDLALFFDAGKVTSSRHDLNFSGLTNDGGIGIRFHGPQATVLRNDLGYGREGYHLVFGFGGIVR
jgi:outer membrane translocation and assembly module TamA